MKLFTPTGKLLTQTLFADKFEGNSFIHSLLSIDFLINLLPPLPGRGVRVEFSVTV